MFQLRNANVMVIPVRRVDLLSNSHTLKRFLNGFP